MRKYLLLFLFIVAGILSSAQTPEKAGLFTVKRAPQPFLFSTTTLTPEDTPWSLDYFTSYGEKVDGPFGFEGLGQQLGVKGYLGKRFTLLAQATFSISGENHVNSAQRVEIIRDLIAGTTSQGFRLGIGLGGGKDFSNVGEILSRVTLSYEAKRWKAGGNLLFQKYLSKNRDKIDVITSLGFHHLLTGNLYGGVEAVGEDLEGLWDRTEAEGGARILLGPSLNMTTKDSKIAFSLSGGPVFYATRSEVTNPVAIRELPGQPGLSLRARVEFNLTD